MRQLTTRPARASARVVTSGVGSSARDAVARGMRGAIARAQPSRGHVRVHLGRAQARVAQQLLDHPQVGAAIEQVAGERVAQGVRRDAIGQPGAPDEPVDALAHAPDAQAAAACVEEQRSVIRQPSNRSRSRGPTGRQPLGQGVDARGPRAVPCAPCGACPGPGSRPVAGPGRDRSAAGQLADAQTRAVRRLDDGPVAQLDGTRRPVAHRRPCPPCSRRRPGHDVEQQLHVRRFEHLGQTLRAARRHDRQPRDPRSPSPARRAWR